MITNKPNYICYYCDNEAGVMCEECGANICENHLSIYKNIDYCDECIKKKNIDKDLIKYHPLRKGLNLCN